MDRPLWQLLLMILLIGYVLRRSALVLGFGLADDGGVPSVLVVSHAVQLGVGLVAGLLVAMIHRWAVPAVGLLSLVLAAGLVLDVLQPEPVSGFGVASGLVALGLTVTLWIGLRRGIGAQVGAEPPTSDP